MTAAPPPAAAGDLVAVDVADVTTNQLRQAARTANTIAADHRGEFAGLWRRLAAALRHHADRRTR